MTAEKFERDLRICCARSASVYPMWTQKCIATHLPSGQSVEFDESWGDRSGRARALADLALRVGARCS